MNDAREIIWTNPTAISADGTYNGPTVDSLLNYAGTLTQPHGPNGIGVQAIISSISGTAFTVALKFQDSDDGTNWFDGETLLKATDVVATLVGTKIVVEARIRPDRRYWRMVATTASMSGESCNVSIRVADGCPIGKTIIRYA